MTDEQFYNILSFCFILNDGPHTTSYIKEKWDNHIGFEPISSVTDEEISIMESSFNENYLTNGFGFKIVKNITISNNIIKFLYLYTKPKKPVFKHFSYLFFTRDNMFIDYSTQPYIAFVILSYLECFESFDDIKKTIDVRVHRNLEDHIIKTITEIRSNKEIMRTINLHILGI